MMWTSWDHTITSKEASINLSKGITSAFKVRFLTLAFENFYCLLITFAKSLDPGCDRQDVLKRLIWKKKQQATKNMKKIPSMQRVKMKLSVANFRFSKPGLFLLACAKYGSRSEGSTKICLPLVSCSCMFKE